MRQIGVPHGWCGNLLNLLKMGEIPALSSYLMVFGFFGVNFLLAGLKFSKNVPTPNHGKAPGSLPGGQQGLVLSNFSEQTRYIKKGVFDRFLSF